MKLEISHLTRYLYEEPVIKSVNEIRLTPKTNHRQSCYHHSIVIEPAVSTFSYDDFFNNHVYSFSIYEPHKEIEIKAHSIVVTNEIKREELQIIPFREELKVLRGEEFQNDYAEYLTTTNYISLTPAIVNFAEEIRNSRPVTSIHELLEQISAMIYSNFTYDPQVTHVYTTVTDFLTMKRGVCQDYAHLMIAICKYLHIPARYVSGYHYVSDLQGGLADFTQASHAWVEAFVPYIGWVGFDPTNNGKINERYVKLGHGRDYSDIVPMKGIYRGTDRQNLEVTVDVRKIED